MNSSAVQSSKDMGKDSLTIPRDAYGYTLYYYGNGTTVNDYTPIGSSNPFSNTPPTLSSFNGLYNGNIAAVSNNITKLTDPWHYYTYKYDQLNRIKASQVYKAGSTATSVADYHEAFTYDGNGNIKTVSRYANAATVMDSLTYHYNTTGGRLNNNRLNYITDAVATHNWPYGLDNQTTNNYTYDATGNMTADVTDTISNVGWTVYNKIQNLTNSKGTITYTYNPAGQRVSKTVGTLTTYYIRDAQGNTLALYDNAHSNSNWKEQELYGSSRLGLWQPNVNLASNNATAVWDTTGNKEYELDNHLGNVLSTITDKRIQHANGTSINYYDADVATAQEYYAFGGLMPGRVYNAQNYLYGFNGKENDNEVKGLGNQQDYGMRIYDPKRAGFLSVDPIGNEYPELTPYQFASNRPIDGVDEDGLEYNGAMFSAFAEGQKSSEDPMKALHKSAETTFKFIGNLIYGTIATATLPLKIFEETDRGGHYAHNSEAYKKLQVEGKQDAKQLAVNVALAYTGGKLLGMIGNGFGETIPIGSSEIENSDLRQVENLTFEPAPANYLTHAQFGELPDKGLIDPNKIRYSQNSIGSSIRGSENQKAVLDDFIADLKAGRIKSEDVPPIRIVERAGKIYTLDNRRLYAYQQANIEIHYIKLDRIPQKELFKFSTTNEGTSINVRAQPDKSQ